MQNTQPCTCIGTNHGSLSDRIMNRSGRRWVWWRARSNLPASRATATLHLLDEVEQPKGDDRVLPAVGRALAKLGPDWNYPLHLGVTEAGDARMAVSRAPSASARCCATAWATPLCLAHRGFAQRNCGLQRPDRADPRADRSRRRGTSVPLSYDPFDFERRNTEVELADGVACGGEQTICVVVTQAAWDKLAPRIRPGDDVKPEGFTRNSTCWKSIHAKSLVNCDTQLITVKDDVGLPAITAFRLLAGRLKALGQAGYPAEGLPDVRRHAARAKHRPAATAV